MGVINMQPFNQAKDAELLWQFLEDMLIHHTAFSHITKVLEQLFNTSGTLRNSVGVFITGLSRSGKTRCTQESESLHPPSRTATGRIVPVLRVEVPSKPTVKGLTSEMLAAYGDPSAEKGTEQDKTRRLLIFIKECQTKMIIIDEIQHFVDKTDKFRIIHHLTDWLKILLNKSNIVIVIVGLPYAEALLNQNEQLRGRFIRTLHLPRFDWRHEQSRGEFLGLMDGFADLLCTKFTLPEIGSIDLAYRFYLASGGLTGYVFNILRQAAWIVIEDGRTNIELEDIDLAYLSVVSQIDQHVTSPFSRKFALNDESALKKASSIGEGTDAFDSEIMHKRYKPKSFREARS